MGKNKLKKFAAMEQMDCVLQYPFAVLNSQGFPYKGRWHQDFFKNDNPIVLELGCGHGEYTVGLARQHKDSNYIGIDIKGARMYNGAKQAVTEGMDNVAFLRTSIELLSEFFAPGEVSEIWITFPDPQMSKTRKRLTSTRFIDLYREILAPEGVINLKTDSPFLYTYTSELLKANNITPIIDTDDLYHSEVQKVVPPIRTHYEQQWLDRGLTIKVLSFTVPQMLTLVEPDVEIAPDTYRSYSRGELQEAEQKAAPYKE